MTARAGRLSFPWHPLLLAAYSVLALAAHNRDEILPGEALTLLIIALPAAGLLWLLLALPARGFIAAALPASALLTALLFYHGLEALFGALAPLPALALTALAGWLVWRPQQRRAANLILNAVTLVLVVQPLFGLVGSALNRAPAAPPPAAGDIGMALPLAAAAPPPRRHVFFLIFDRYAAGVTLAEQFGYDNRGFEDFLRRQGFYLAVDSRANYLKTAHSLAASFNLDYLDELAASAGRDSGDWQPLYMRLLDHRVLHTFRRLGYRFVQLGSWWQPTRFNALADENYHLDVVSELQRVYLNTTAVPALAELFGVDTMWLSFDDHALHCRRVPYKFRELRRLAERDEALFVFAHMLVPHPPYLFDADGRCLNAAQRAARSERDGYIAQLQYVNAELRRLVIAIRGLAPDAAIILQADEGPFPRRYAADEEGFDWRRASVDELKLKFAILNALYLPGVPAAELRPSLSPVNTFRLLLNAWFDAALPILPDRSYVLADHARLYDFIEVTDLIGR